MSYPKPDFCRRIEKLMFDLGVTKAHIVEHSHYNRRTLSRHLDPKDDSLPRLDDLVALARILNTSLDYICYGRGISYIADVERNALFTILEKFSDESMPEYLILTRALARMGEDELGLIADFAALYESRQAKTTFSTLSTKSR